MRRPRALVTAASVSLIAGLGVSAIPVASAQSSGRTVLAGTAAPAAARTPSIGATPASSPVDFQADLALPDQAAAQAFSAAVSTPGNAQYRHFLTPAQWEARFSPSAASVAAVSAWLRSEGFTVGAVPADRMVVPASGTAAQVEKAFGTTLSTHVVNGAQVRLADTNLSVPTSVAGMVAGLTGVSQNFEQPNDTTDGAPAPATTSANAAAEPGTPGSIPPPAAFVPAPPCGTSYNQKLDTRYPAYGNGYPSSPPYVVCGYKPGQIRSAYSLTGDYSSGANGKGVTVAVVDAFGGSTLLADAQRYFQVNSPTTPFKAGQFKELLNTPFQIASLPDAEGWSGEQTLDIQSVHTTAPGADIVYVGAKSDSNLNLENAVREVVDNHLADIATNSYGDNAGDLLDTPADRATNDQLFLLAGATGVSMLFSSGDDGDALTTTGVTSPSYPASSPYVTAAGGTTLAVGANGQRLFESGWSTGKSLLCTATLVAAKGCTAAQRGKWLAPKEDGGSGGGTSYDYAQPSYQAGIVPNSEATAHSNVNGSKPMRVVPDISAIADPGTGFLVGETQTFPNGVRYGEYRIGGTSVASPMLAGIMALAVQLNKGDLGFLNPAIYHLSGGPQIYDVVQNGKQIQSRVDYVNSVNASQGELVSTRIIDYQGFEHYCVSQGKCVQQRVAIAPGPGYDNMTGLGTPSTGFAAALAGIVP